MKIGRKKWENASGDEKVSYLKELFKGYKGALEKRHLEWYLNYMFKEGHHYASYNTVTNSLETPPRKKGEVRMVVNLVKSYTRAIRNYATSTEPKWEVLPGDIDDDTIVNARRSGKLLDYIYRDQHLETLVSGAVDSALDTSVAWVELDWDEKASGGEGQVKYKLHDSFEVWPDPWGMIYAGKYVGKAIFKTVKRPTEQVKEDERYDFKDGRRFTRKDVSTDDDLAVSEQKSRIIRRERGNTDEKTKYTTVYEALLYSTEKNPEGGNITLFTFGGGQPLREKYLKRSDFPLYCYQIPMDPRKIYHRSWTADAIPLNKALNRVISQKIMYVNQALVYRIIAEKGHGMMEVDNEMGHVYEINKGRKWEQMPMQNLPTTLDSLNRDMQGLMETLLGVQDASLGRNPTGVRSGDLLEGLQAAASNNLADIHQSLASFLSVLGSATLDMIAEKYQSSRVIKLTEPEMEDGQPVNYIRVQGKEAPKPRKDATIINKDNEVIVKIGSWLGYTKEAQRETLIKLAEAGVIPAEEVLRQLEFPNITELSRKAQEQRLEQHKLDAEIAGRNGQGGGQPGPGGDLIALADKENTEMMNGQPLPPTEGATLEHTQAHMDFMNTQTFQTANPQIQQVIAQHVQGERQALGM